MPSCESLFEHNFLHYASYVIRDRAIPSIVDGLKPVQRRILHTLMEMDDGRFHKVSNIIGSCMKYHPHGDQSIFAALINLAQKGLFIETQGNFGNIFTGDEASAPRYIECRISSYAKEILLNKKITSYVDSYDGRNKEPIAFPAMMPLVLQLGVEGIAVGMSTTILPHNPREILQALRAALDGKKKRIYPDFPTGGIIDTREYDDGRGRVRVRAKIDIIDNKKLCITELPYGKSTELLIRSIEQASQKRKCNIAEIHDYTAETVEIELKTTRGTTTNEVIDTLYAFTDCEVSLSSDILVIRDEKPRQMSVSEIIEYHAKQLYTQLEAMLMVEKYEILQELRKRSLEQIFIEERIYHNVEDKKTPKDIEEEIIRSMNPHIERISSLYNAPITKNDIDHLLRIPIRKITLYDIEKTRKDMEQLQTSLEIVRARLENVVGYAKEFLSDIEKKYVETIPERRSKVEVFEGIDARAVAIQNIPVYYDKTRRSIGTKVSTGERALLASEFDKIILLRTDGQYSVVPLPEKLMCGDILFCGFADKESLQGYVFTIVYTNQQGQAYIKRCKILKYMVNKSYSLIPEGSHLLGITLADKGTITIHFSEIRRNMKRSMQYKLQDYAIKGSSTKGQRLHTRGVKRVDIS